MTFSEVESCGPNCEYCNALWKADHPNCETEPCAVCLEIEVHEPDCKCYECRDAHMEVKR